MKIKIICICLLSFALIASADTPSLQGPFLTEEWQDYSHALLTRLFPEDQHFLDLTALYVSSAADTRITTSAFSDMRFISASSGFFCLVENESEVAAVLAHEFGHVKLNHQNTKKLTVVRMAGPPIWANRIVPGVEFQRFDTMRDENIGLLRKQEMEADAFAMHTLMQRGYDPCALLSILDKIIETQEKEDDTHRSVYADRRAQIIQNCAKPDV